MKTITLCIPLLLAAASAMGAVAEEPRQVTVTGTSTLQVPPDYIVWHLSLTEENAVLDEAKQASDVKLKEVLAAVKALGVATEDTQTGNVSIHKEYKHDSRGRRTDFSHYALRRPVTITQRELGRFDEFFENIVALADVEVRMESKSDTIHEHRWENRLEAARIAKEKAQALAETMGAKLGSVVRIDEHPQGEQAMLAARAANIGSNFITEVPWQGPSAEDRVSGTYAPGSIVVTNTVFAVFSLQ